ncbi:TetR/AcrR family transcriptional regulator [Leifsonia sp. TF02-11]|uniref:TetR/AcrR family transcriptional regulator n=1 Tax=Leifsonia sp. TF02-11 TaxID=2815212 RepID=UPI001FB6119B|nr:TetR/AcrR family transcriptional regulator [Leifsonia sp. TF02-11]
MGRDGAPSRRSVLDAVGRIVAERGLEGIRVREIAAEANLSPGAVLYHFPDQSDLLMAVHRDIVARYIDGRRGAIDPEVDAWTNLLNVMRAGVPGWADEKMIRLLYEMHGLARRSQPHAELLSDLWIAERSIYRDIIESGIRAGDFSPPEEPDVVAAQLLALEDGLVLHQISRNENVDGEAVVKTFAQASSTLLARADGSRLLPDSGGVQHMSGCPQPFAPVIRRPSEES